MVPLPPCEPCVDQLVQALCSNSSCIIVGCPEMDVELEGIRRQVVNELREKGRRVIENWRGEALYHSDVVICVDESCLLYRLDKIAELVSPRARAVCFAYGSWELLEEVSRKDIFDGAARVFNGHVFCVQPWARHVFELELQRISPQGIRVPPSTMNTIYSLTGGHSHLAKRLKRLYTQEGWTTEEQLAQALEDPTTRDIIERIVNAVKRPDEREVLEKVARGKRRLNQSERGTADWLWKLGLLRKEGTEYRISADLVGQCLQSRSQGKTQFSNALISLLRWILRNRVLITSGIVAAIECLLLCLVGVVNFMLLVVAVAAIIALYISLVRKLCRSSHVGPFNLDLVEMPKDLKNPLEWLNFLTIFRALEATRPIKIAALLPVILLFPFTIVKLHQLPDAGLPIPAPDHTWSIWLYRILVYGVVFVAMIIDSLLVAFLLHSSSRAFDRLKTELVAKTPSGVPNAARVAVIGNAREWQDRAKQCWPSGSRRGA